MVDDFVYRVNSNIRVRQDSERLKGIIARIESYDVVVLFIYLLFTPTQLTTFLHFVQESKDEDIDKLLKQNKTLMQLDLRRPMINCPPERKRHLLREGDLKLKDNLTSKVKHHHNQFFSEPKDKRGTECLRVITRTISSLSGSPHDG